MEAWQIDDGFLTSENAEVLSFLRATNPSAHSDVAEELSRAGERISGLRSYCPDTARYAFVALHRQDRSIIGLAFGLSGLAFRLPQDRVREAIQAGGRVAVEIGPLWVRFDPWTDGETLVESRRRLAHWCSVAAGSRAD